MKLIRIISIVFLVYFKFVWNKPNGFFWLLGRKNCKHLILFAAAAGEADQYREWETYGWLDTGFVVAELLSRLLCAVFILLEDTKGLSFVDDFHGDYILG